MEEFWVSTCEQSEAEAGCPDVLTDLSIEAALPVAVEEPGWARYEARGRVTRGHDDPVLSLQGHEAMLRTIVVIEQSL